jgi:hypothetical protein
VIELGTLDRITVVVGERGVGKSTLTRRDSRAFQLEMGGLVIGHSPNGQIGAAPFISFADSMRELERGLRRKPEQQWILTTGEPEELLDYASALSLALRKRAHQRVDVRFKPTRPPPPGLDATPLLVVIDEGAHLKRHPTNEEVERLEHFLVGARHAHVALTYSIQAPTKRAWILMEQASRFRVFRYSHEYGQNALRAAGLPQEVTEELGSLPNYMYWHQDKAEPGRGRFVTLEKRDERG